MAGRGRPSKYGDAIHKAIVDELLLGSSRTTAAEMCGITLDTLNEWAGQPPHWDGKFPEFSRDVRLAIAKVKRTASVTIRRSIQEGDVQAAFRYLAYQEPHEWTDPPTKHEVTGADGGPLTIRVIYADHRSDAS